MEAENKIIIDRGSLGSRDWGFHGSHMSTLTQAINEYNDPSVANWVRRKTEDKVHADRLPIVCRDRETLQGRRGWRRRLDSLARVTRANVELRMSVHTGPPEGAGHREISLLSTQVSADGSVVIFVKNIQAKNLVKGDDDSRLIVGLHRKEQQLISIWVAVEAGAETRGKLLV
jgi:hypothetical protein